MKQLVLFVCMISAIHAMDKKDPHLYTPQDVKEDHKQKIARDKRFKNKDEMRAFLNNQEEKK